MIIDSGISGRWVTQDEDSDLELTILFMSGDPTITARSRSDAEQLEVRDIRVEGDTLSFLTIVPSSGYRVHNKMRFLTANTCEMELTLREKWKRMNAR